MKLIKTITTIVASLALFVSGHAFAGGGPHVRVFDGVTGGTLNVAGSDIDLTEFSVSDGRGAGKVDIAVGNQKDAQFLQNLAEAGRNIRSATISGEDKQGYYKITFSDLIVSSYQSGGSSSNSQPMESFSLNFSKIEYQY